MTDIIFKAADNAFRLAEPGTTYVTIKVSEQTFKVARSAGTYAIIG